MEEEGACGITSAVLKYPGATDVININESNNKKFWPEVDFVEEYVKSTTYRISDYKFATINTGISKQFTPINVRDWPAKTVPYITKDNTEFLFEILDRAQAAITFGGLMTRYQGIQQSNLISEALLELAGYEGQNISKQIEQNPNLQEFISSITSFEDIEIKLKSTSPYSFSVYENFGIITPFNQKTFTIKTIPNNSFEIVTKNYSLNSSALKVSKNTGFFDVIPFIFPVKFMNELSGPQFNIDNVNEYYENKKNDSGFGSGLLDYTEGSIKDSLTPIDLNSPTAIINQDVDQTTQKLTSMLNTPYFINSLLQTHTH